jgi:hypothetical protein
MAPWGERVADKKPEIILTDVRGEHLGVDLLAYPEDTYLVVDPYSPLDDPATPAAQLVVEAEATLPRSMGEILPARLPGVTATRVVRLVLLDFNQPCPCRGHVVEETLRRLIREGAQLGTRHLGLDRFELLEPCISAYRLLSCLLREMERLGDSGLPPPERLTFALHRRAALRHYEVALANLPGI